MRKAYIPHYKPLVSRLRSIKETCKELNLEACLVKAYDKEELVINRSEKDLYENTWKSRIDTISKILKINAGLDQNDINPAWTYPRKLKMSEISLTYKHFLCLLKIYQEDEIAIVMEDDILIKKESRAEVEKAYEKIREGYDYIDLGGGCSLPIFENDKRKNSYLITIPPRSRTTACYMITPKAAMQIAKNMFPCIFPLDWSYQYIFIKEDMKVLWTIPAALEHGSQATMRSSIQ